MNTKKVHGRSKKICTFIITLICFHMCVILHIVCIGKCINTQKTGFSVTVLSEDHQPLSASLLQNVTWRYDSASAAVCVCSILVGSPLSEVSPKLETWLTTALRWETCWVSFLLYTRYCYNKKKERTWRIFFVWRGLKNRKNLKIGNVEFLNKKLLSVSVHFTKISLSIHIFISHGTNITTGI